MKHRNRKGQPSERKFGDSRALMAALARLMAGVILTLMFCEYFSAPDVALTHSRLWWEIVLNVQLLGAGMVFYSYSDRISPLAGRLRLLQIARVFFAICAVMTPTVLGLLAAIYGWFIVPPQPWIFKLVAGLACLHLIGSLILYFRIEGGSDPEKIRHSFGYHLVFFSPGLIFMLLLALSILYQGNAWIILLPLLVYTQGAMPYVMEFAGFTTAKNYN